MGDAKRQRSRSVVCALVGHSREALLEAAWPALATQAASEFDLLVGIAAGEKAAAEGRPPVGVLACDHGEVDEATLARLGGRVKVVSNFGVGVEHINLAECAARGVRVGNTPDVLSGSTADTAWTLLMATARRVQECVDFARGPDFLAYDNNRLLGRDVHGSVLGIVGMGRIGEEVAKRARGFGMEVLYHNRSRKPAEREAALGVRYAVLDDLLAAADHVVLVCPLTPETRGLIGAAQLKRMKPTATLVNVARGGVVDTDALTAALRERRIFGAGLDVTEPEPLPRGHPLLALPNCTILPHRGSATQGTREAMAALCLANLRAGLGDAALPACCNEHLLRAREQ